MDGLWLTAEQVAELEGITPRGIRKKYLQVGNGLMRRVRCFGGKRVEFHVEILPAELQAKAVELFGTDKERRPPVVLHPDQGPEPMGATAQTAATLPPQGSGESNERLPVPTTTAQIAGSLSTTIIPRLPFLPPRIDTELHGIPQRNRPWALARWRAIQQILDNTWQRWQGQTVHGITISSRSDYVKAVAYDSAQAVSVLVDWSGLNAELRAGLHAAAASLTPLSEGTLWRWLSWFKRGRSDCPACHHRHCICGRAQRLNLPPGLIALHDPPATTTRRISICEEHQRYLVAAAMNGDSSVPAGSLALERPRSVNECLELLKNEIAIGALPGPLPSPSALKRYLRNVLPRVLRDYASNGAKRALARQGPYIVRDHKGIEVNDTWYCDFRRVNVRAWLDRDGPLYRVWCCAIIDAASRDVIINFDFTPSTGLFKSTLRNALLAWGRPRQLWMDNGKEFTADELLGSGEFRIFRRRFEVDADCESIFASLSIEPHYCLKENPDGKALIERFFQFLDAEEAKLPGATGRNDKERPERLKREERRHHEFQAELRPESPLWRIPKLIDYLTRRIDARYRHRSHKGDGMYGRSPAQVQAAYRGLRYIPAAEELDILLWKRVQAKIRGDKISLRAFGRTLIFRSERLFATPGDGRVEVHVDPLNADRALALHPAFGVVLLEPVVPVGGKAGADLKAELTRQRHLERTIKRAAVAASRLAAIPGPEEALAKAEQVATRKQAALDTHRRDRRKFLPLPEYAAAKRVLAAKAEEEIPVDADDPAEDVTLPRYDFIVEEIFTSQTQAEANQCQQLRKPTSS